MEQIAPKLYYISILTQSGVTIYQQNLGEKLIDPQILDSISTIALGFKNTMDVSLSSINYQNYTIYFRKGANFLAVLLANTAQGVHEIIDNMFNDMINQNIVSKFIEFAKHEMPCSNNEITERIKRILYNLDFISSINEMKSEFHNFRRF